MTARVRLLWFTVVLFALLTLPAFAANVRIVRLSLAQGDVQIDRNSGDGWEQAINNMPVIGGTRIYAAEGAKAELEFEDGSSLRLVGPAQISLSELSAANDGSLVNQVQVDSGIVYANVQLHQHDSFRVAAATGESFDLTQPSKLRFTVDQQTASLAMMQGEAVVAQSGQSNSRIRSGETYNYVLGQPESAARLESVPTQPEDSWDQQRDSYADQYASAGAQYSGSDESNAAGVADLGYYGTYSNVPGYGVLWRPSGYGVGWDPFSNGAWSFYPGWGWTFVSGYNWGWTPFFYGDWCFVNGRGWWWRPGPRHPHGGGGGWHPQPRWTGTGPARGWNRPRPPAARAPHGTVAIAGSHLAVGPIGTTHAPGAAHGFGNGNSGNGASTIVRPNGRGAATPNLGRGRGTSNLVHGAAVLNPGLTPTVNPRGSYTLNGPATGSNGTAVQRPRTTMPRTGSNLSGRSNSGSAGVPLHEIPGTHYGSGIAPVPRTVTGPPPSVQHGPSAPPVSMAPHVSSGGVGGTAPRSGGGGGFGGGGFHGGEGGGASHSGGGHR